jgi:hypothetical protein
MARKIIDLNGKAFARLTVIEFAGQKKGGRALWRCRCECGKEAVVPGDCLRDGRSRSCGCLKLEMIRGNKYGVTHEACGHPLFHVWNGMMARCNNKKHQQYADYGGRGIKVCERWRDPWKFFEDMGERPDGATLERVNNGKGYDPENCRWATRKEQMRNKRTNRLIRFRGQTKPLSQWAEEVEISEATIRDRIDKLKWTVAKALTTPPRKVRK